MFHGAFLAIYTENTHIYGVYHCTLSNVLRAAPNVGLFPWILIF